jgi:hypothetical protein
MKKIYHQKAEHEARGKSASHNISRFHLTNPLII